MISIGRFRSGSCPWVAGLFMLSLLIAPGFALSVPTQAQVYPAASCQGAITDPGFPSIRRGQETTTNGGGQETTTNGAGATNGTGAVADPDLAITKTVRAALARPGQAITYTIQYVNHGPDVADAVTVTDQLPAGVWPMSTAASPAWLTETFAGGVYTWTFGSVPTATVGYITVTAQISGSLADGVVLTNTAGITAAGDVTTTNNAAWAATTVDALTPTAVITSPVADAWVQGSVPISGAAHDAHLDRYVVDWRPASGGAWTTIHVSTTAVTSGVLATWNTAGVADGPYVIRLTVTDTVGYVGTDSVTVTVDHTPPTAVIAAPGAGSYVSGTVAITGTASDLYLDGYAVSYGSGVAPATWTVISTGTTSVTDGALGAWNTVGLVEGLYTLRLAVTDTIGHVSTSSVTVTVDNTPPTAAITFPITDAFVIAAAPITGTATDANFARYTVCYGAGDNPASFPHSIGAYTTAVANGLLATWSSLPAADGPYTLQLLVYDQAGWTAQVTRTVRVDTQWPTATITAPTAGALVSRTVGITGTATDRYFGRYEVQYGVGAGPGSWTRIGAVHTNTVTGGCLEIWNTGGVIEEGVYTLRLVVTDTVGHTSMDSRVITVDNKAPTPPSALTITPDTWVSTNVFTVSWSTNPSDASGIAGAYYKLGTAPISPTDGIYRAGVNIKSISGITATVDGEYEVHVWLRDGVGNANQDNRQSKMAIHYDATAPAVTLAPPPRNEWRGGEIYTIAWTAADATSGLKPTTPITLSYSTDGGGAWTTIAVTNHIGSYLWMTPMEDSDRCRVRVEAVDQAGNVGQAQSGNFTIDSTAPGPPANLTAAPPGWTRVNGFTVSWDNPADLTGVAGAYYKVGEPPASATDGVYQAGDGITSVVGISVTASGAYSVHVWLQDGVGNVSRANRRSATLYYDAISPTVSIVSPAGGEKWKAGDNKTITWSASDAHSGLPTNPIAISYTTDAGSTWQPIVSGTANDGSHNWTLPPVDSARCQVRLRATDRAGNANQAASGVFIIDNIPPTVSLTTPLVVQTTSFQVTWSATDTSGIAGYDVQYKVNDGAWQNWLTNVPSTTTAATFGPTSPITVQGGVTYTFQARARDGVGRQGAWAKSRTHVPLFRLYLPLTLKSYRAPCDQYEPNDTRATAWGPLQSDVEYRAKLCQWDPTDYYTCVLSAGTWVVIDLTVPPMRDYDLYLYDDPTSQTPVAKSDRYGNVNEHIEYRTTKTSLYYVRVYPYNYCYDDDHDYVLCVHYEACDPYEPNNTRVEARGPLETGTTYSAKLCEGDPTDYYRFTTTGGAITIDLTVPGNVDYDLYLYYNDQSEPVAKSDLYGNGVPEHISYTGKAGTYYVRVYPYSGRNNNDPYTLRVDYP